MDEQAITNLEVKTLRRYSYRAVIVAYLLVFGAIGALAVVSWHRDKVNSLREQYSQQHGPIDIPEALYFDSMACSVQIPVLLLWFVLQLTSAFVFCVNSRGVGYSGGLVFWMLWSIAWGLCLI